MPPGDVKESQPQPGAPAEAAGLKAGDVITAVNGEKIDGPRELARRIEYSQPEEAYLAGLLHNVGRLALRRFGLRPCTPKGVMTDRKARASGVGGEVLCVVA